MGSTDKWEEPGVALTNQQQVRLTNPLPKVNVNSNSIPSNTQWDQGHHYAGGIERAGVEAAMMPSYQDWLEISLK